MLTAFFHAHAADSSLGLPQLVTQVPLMRLDRVERLFSSASPHRDPVVGCGDSIVQDTEGQRA